jgi:hypothetical protein
MRKWIAGLATIAACSSDASGPDGTPNAGRHIAVQAGATQSGVMGQPTLIAPSVIVTNTAGAPLAGIVVTFTIASGGGTLSSATATTDASGIASVSWTLGKTFGTQSLDASAPNAGSVGFHATAIAPDAGILAFDVSDPEGDTLAYAGFPQPRALDLTRIRGDFKRDSLILTLTFSGSVTHANTGGPDGLYGFIEFDIDDRASTGEIPESNAFGATATLGIDFLLDLFDEDGLRTAVLLSPTSGTIVPISFSGNSAVVRIPMSLLGDDDGNFSIVGTIGLIDRATDVIPNTGGTVIRP